MTKLALTLTLTYLHDHRKLYTLSRRFIDK